MIVTKSRPAMLVSCDAEYNRRLVAQRQALGQDRHDEVWDGVYVMSPLADIEHQLIATRMAMYVQMALGLSDPALVLAGTNVSDRDEGWEHNYRIPDLAVYLAGNRARNCGTHWMGGPDFGMEISSQGDRTREKLDFYAQVGTRELLIVDRDPWALELYALKRRKLRLVGRATVATPDELASVVLPLRFRLAAGQGRPAIEVQPPGQAEPWRV